MRQLTWIVDINGNTGKTEFMASLCQYERGDFINIDSGMERDIAFIVKECLEAPVNPWTGWGVFLDLPRQNEDNKSIYKVLEKVRNGRMTSTKYEPKRLEWEADHVIVFSNWEPERAQLSEDRWNIIHIDKNRLTDCMPLEEVKAYRKKHNPPKRTRNFYEKYNEMPPEV